MPATAMAQSEAPKGFRSPNQSWLEKQDPKYLKDAKEWLEDMAQNCSTICYKKIKQEREKLEAMEQAAAPRHRGKAGASSRGSSGGSSRGSEAPLLVLRSSASSAVAPKGRTSDRAASHSDSGRDNRQTYLVPALGPRAGPNFQSPVPDRLGRAPNFQSESPMPDRRGRSPAPDQSDHVAARYAANSESYRSRASRAASPEVPGEYVIQRELRSPRLTVPKRPWAEPGPKFNAECTDGKSGTVCNLDFCVHPGCDKREHMSRDPRFKGHCCMGCKGHYDKVYQMKSHLSEKEASIPHGLKCGTPYVGDIPNKKERKRQGYSDHHEHEG